MAKLKRMVTYTDYRWEATDELTSKQLEMWNSENEELREEVVDQVDFELVRDKCLEDHSEIELIEEK